MRIAILGAALATCCAARKPLAPGLSSTTTVCFVASYIAWPTPRASWSVALPAANGTTKVTGFEG